MDLSQYTGKVDGTSTLAAAEWNGCMTTIQNAVTALEQGGSSTGCPYVKKTDKNNVELFAPESLVTVTSGKRSGGKVNVEASSDIQMKPADDIIMYSHHRSAPGDTAGTTTQTKEMKREISLKIANGGGKTEAGADTDDFPVKLQVNLANLTLTTKDKDLTKMGGTVKEDEILDVNVNTGKDKASGNNEKGYLKVRARAIDLRCEEHGGIALQPKGYDTAAFMNKIKFEHGGGDGLEFFTANTDKFSAYNNEYRFNKNGIWKQATRTTSVSTKYDSSDETTHYVYNKQSDDFYDIIATTDETCTTGDIIKTAHAFNSGKDRHAKITSAGNLEVQTNKTYHWVETTGTVSEQPLIPTDLSDVTAIYNANDTETLPTTGGVYQQNSKLYTWTEIESPEIKIQSDNDITIKSDGDDVILKADDSVKAEADEIRLTADTLLSLSTTPKIICLSQKLTKSAQFEANNTVLTTGFLNNTIGNIYRLSDGTIKLPTIDLYTDEACTIAITADITEGTPIYYKENNVGTPCAADSKYFTMISSSPYMVATKSKSSTVKSISACTSTTHPNVTFVSPSYTPTTGETTVASGNIAEGTKSCTIADLINLVNYMQTNNQGPWAS